MQRPIYIVVRFVGKLSNIIKETLVSNIELEYDYAFPSNRTVEINLGVAKWGAAGAYTEMAKNVTKKVLLEMPLIFYQLQNNKYFIQQIVVVFNKLKIKFKGQNSFI